MAKPRGGRLPAAHFHFLPAGARSGEVEGMEGAGEREVQGRGRGYLGRGLRAVYSPPNKKAVSPTTERPWEDLRHKLGPRGVTWLLAAAR